MQHLGGNRDFNLDASFDVNDDLLDDLGGCVETGQKLSAFLRNGSFVDFNRMCVATHSIKRL